MTSTEPSGQALAAKNSNEIQEPRLIFRLDFGDGRRMGLGTLKLLEGLARSRSLLDTADAMQISERRAHELVDRLNGMFQTTVIIAETAAAAPERHSLTDFGHSLLAQLREVNSAANAAAAAQMATIAAAFRTPLK